MSKSKRTAKHGRQDGESYVKLPKKILRSAAWRDTSHAAKVLYLEILCIYHGPNTSAINLSVRWVAEFLGCNQVRAGRLLRELIEHGFLARGFRADFNTKDRKASEYYITWKDHVGRRHTSEWRDWSSRTGTVTDAVNPRKRASKAGK